MLARLVEHLVEKYTPPVSLTDIRNATEGRKRDIVDRLRYADQDLDHGQIAKVKLTCWDAHLEIEKLRKQLKERT